jgi:hypothetical protein
MYMVLSVHRDKIYLEQVIDWFGIHINMFLCPPGPMCFSVPKSSADTISSFETKLWTNIYVVVTSAILSSNKRRGSSFEYPKQQPKRYQTQSHRSLCILEKVEYSV